MIEAERILAEHGYKMGKFIGNGMTSECFQVFSNNFQQNESFVCKIFELFPRESRNIITKHFDDEVAILTKLDHPSIIRCYDYFKSENYLVIIFEFCTGGSLNHTLSHTPKLDMKQFFGYAFQLLDAIIYCHKRRIAHLDIKPQNIFLSKYGKLKLSDFGCAKTFAPNEKMKQKRGSQFFMAPEIGVTEYDPFKADIYSIGVTLLVMYNPLIVAEVREADNVWMLLRDTAATYGEFGQIIYDCLDREPEKRPSAEDLKKRLYEYATANFKLPMLVSSQSGVQLFPQMGQKQLPALKVAPCASLKTITAPSAFINLRRGSMCRAIIQKH